MANHVSFKQQQTDMKVNANVGVVLLLSDHRPYLAFPLAKLKLLGYHKERSLYT